MSKSKFVKYMSQEHLNKMNIALYSSGALRVENLVSGKGPAAKQFESVDAAQAWYDRLPGSGLGRLENAIELLTGQDTAA